VRATFKSSVGRSRTESPGFKFFFFFLFQIYKSPGNAIRWPRRNTILQIG